MTDFFHYLYNHLPEIWSQTKEHLLLTSISMGIASLIGVSIGVLMTRFQPLAKSILGLIGIIQTIPSLALLGFLLPLFGIGMTSAIIALFLYALLPIVSNTYTGLTEVPIAIRSSAVGMGMTQGQLLRYVELPLAFPTILVGIKTATVINVGVATLCAYIGAGGLGEYIFRGISLNNTSMILAGAIPASALAVSLDFLIGKLAEKKQRKWLAIPLVLCALLTFIPSAQNHSSKLVAGFNSEFIERADGFVGLDSLYDLPMDVREMEIGLMYKSLRDGYVEVIHGFSTDGRVKAYDLSILTDDQGYFPPYYAAPIIRTTTLNQHPELKGLFERFSNLISNVQMAALNNQVDEEQRDISEVSYEFLTSTGIRAYKDAGNSDNPDIIIGSKAFTESYLLAYMFAQAIEAHTALKTEVKLGFGGTKIIFDALNYGEIDLYPEYTGTGLLVILKNPLSDKLNTPDKIYRFVSTRFEEEFEISWMPPLGFNNTSALMMRRAHADSLNIHSISDLSAYLNQ